MRLDSGKDCDSLWDARRALAAGRNRQAALTYAEVLMSVVIVAVVFGLTIKAYLMGAQRAEWTGFSLAAQSEGIQAIEEARSAVWDLALQKNELTNMIQGVNVVSYTLPASGSSNTLIVTTNILDLPWKGTNYILATNYINIVPVNENLVAGTTVLLQFIRVDTVWGFWGWGNYAVHYYTNTIATYMAPDNRDPSTLGY